ncbi:class I adenylate-forming enzyme family protein [Methanobacterium ferruginis]|uniref:class I adenylate-forming enzyme family protein n=1 Tax=Methanobacterium ferruginis TaxID=710191 RepID=UPI002573A20B|nr:class I adenylate-forming enzyme family protein [Methanobacterium ferruginis]BDZ68995.1 long-chain-fatty-acid--CoA ligase [Methanobacterium ferruginis]
MNKKNTGTLLKNIFKKKWQEELIIDGVNERSFTYEDFFNLALTLGDELSYHGLEKGDILCLLMDNSLGLLVSYFACLLSGFTVLPIDPYKGEREIAEILSLVAYKKIICDSNEFEYLDKVIKFSNFDLKSKKIKVTPHISIFENLDYDQLFLITYTSGSTGTPKGVMHSFNNLVSTSIAFNKEFNFGEENIFYHNLPMTYMAGILNLFVMPLICESKIVLGERFSISNIMRFWDLPVKYSVNTFWFIPTIISLLMKLDRGENGVKYSQTENITGCVGTAPLNHKLKEDFETKYNIHLYESYGLSETLFVSSNSSKVDYVDNAVGKVLEGVEIDFTNDKEILINVPWMFLGYANLKNQNCENGKFKSGDLGKFTEEHILMITGRKKDLIIKGGINISPRKIEDYISGLEFFEEQVIMGLEDPVLGETTACVYIPKNSFQSNDKKQINDELSHELGRDYIIDQFIELEEIPKNINGKVDKIKIKELYGV